MNYVYELTDTGCLYSTKRKAILEAKSHGYKVVDDSEDHCIELRTPTGECAAINKLLVF